MTNDDFFAAKAAEAKAKLAEWAAVFENHLARDGRNALVDGCVYAVGSAGRGELGNSSDLDVFVVTNDKPSRLDEILVQAALIRTMRQFRLPDPSNEASFLRLHGAEELEQRLGAVEDDSLQNTFTARMLLLLESQPFYGTEGYRRLLDRVVKAYWRNHERHRDDYLPMLLVNDIVRYWRVVLLNYEAKFARKEREAKIAEGDIHKHAKEKRLASYKLRFARCMTCYSMIVALLWESRFSAAGKPHVSPETMLALVDLSPIQRMQRVLAGANAENANKCAKLIAELLELYLEYLRSRSMPDGELKPLLDVAAPGGSLFFKADDFGARMSALVQELGQNSPLIRYVVV